MERMRRAVASVCCASLLLAQTPARADATSSAAAEQLFQDGKKLLEAGKTHEACEKFAASQQMDPGLGTLLHLASCHEKEGKIASAWAEYNEAQALAQDRGEKEREKFARDHAASLEKQLHRVVLEMTQRPDGLEIKVDGKAFALGSLGTAIPIDPGAHQLEVRAPKKKTWTQAITLGPSAATERIDIKPLEDDPTAPEPGARPGDARPANPAVEQGTPPDLTKRYLGIGLGVAGVALGVVAVVEELTAVARDKTSTDDFNNSQNPPPGTDAAQWRDASKTANSQAKTAQTFAIIFGATGAAALGVGIYLVATSFGSSPKASTQTGIQLVPHVTPGGGGLGLTGTF